MALTRTPHIFLQRLPNATPLIHLTPVLHAMRLQQAALPHLTLYLCLTPPVQPTVQINVGTMKNFQSVKGF